MATRIPFTKIYSSPGKFLDIISPDNDMLDKMNDLFSKFPEVDLAALGFPVGWENEPLWR